MIYNYTEQNLLEEQQGYMYTPFGWQAFLEDYLRNRAKAKKQMEELDIVAVESLNHETSSYTEGELNKILAGLKNKKIEPDALEELENYLRRFEVAKKLRARYHVSPPADYVPFSVYPLFAEILSVSYILTRDIRYLNTLLKVNDTIISVIDNFTEKVSVLRAIEALNTEVAGVKKLASEHGINLQ
jgi:hypothetical protein|tara:strand:- start:1414 stop:1971 length:558 start_codon:yes stop_codon:yes gene_type:complete